MTIPQAVVEALAAIPAENPLPDVTTMSISQASLSTIRTQLQCWTAVRDICKAQFDQAQTNATTLQSQAAAMAALLGE